MPVPPQLLLSAMQLMKNRKSTKDQIKEALAPATDVLKNNIAPLVSMGADAGMMYNLRAEDPSMRTGIATGAIGAAAKGFQSGGIGGLLTGGITGALTGAIATGNAKEQKAEQDKYTYLNQMYGSVVGQDDYLGSLMYAEDGGEIVSPEGEVFVPIQTEAKKIGKKLVKEKLIFSDGTIADVNATKPHSEQKKDDVTDIAVEGTYVMPVSTKLSKKDLDSIISYSTSKYSENGKNFAVQKVTVRDILGDDFEGSFAEATDIVTKKYPVMDTDDDMDPMIRVTNNENLANRSKIIAHLVRLNEAKINKTPIEEDKLAPDMKAKAGGYIKKYVLGSVVSNDPTRPKSRLEARKDKYQENKPKPVNQYSIRAYEPDSKAKSIYKKLVAPVSAMDNRPDTSYEDPSGLDVALGVFNPFAWIDGAATVLNSSKNIITGEGEGKDYATVGVAAAGSALGLRGSKSKTIGDKISKFVNNMYNPAAGVTLKKPTLNTPEGFQNRVFDSNVQLGQFSGKGHLSESGYNYRVLSPAEIDAIAETRGVFPRAGKQKGGNENTKYWTKGNEKNWYGDKSNLETIRVKQDRFSTDKVVSADDVEVYNKVTGKFEPLSVVKKMKLGGYVKKMAKGGDPTKNILYLMEQANSTGSGPMPSILQDIYYGAQPEDITVANDLDPSFRNIPPVSSNTTMNILGQSLDRNGKLSIKSLPKPNTTLRSMNPVEIMGQKLNPDGTPFTSPNSSTLDDVMNAIDPNADTNVLDEYKQMISERKGDAVRDAGEAKKGYNALSRRVGFRDLMNLGTGLVGIGLQDRTEKRAFKRPLYIDQKYRGLSPQQINAEAGAASGAGVEAIKQMMNGGGDRITARLAPVLLDRLLSQQGSTRKAYVDQNTALERGKYAERAEIQQSNLNEEARAQNAERDYNNKAIADTSSLISKYTSSRNAADINKYGDMMQIDRDLTDKLYKLDNQGMQVDMIGKDYDMQIADVKTKIADIEAQLSNPNLSIDAAQKASLESYKNSYKKIQEDLEKRKIRQNIG